MRSCLLCAAPGSYPVEDEKHVVLDCPAYGGVRADPRFSALFALAASEGLPSMFAVPHQSTLAQCISSLLSLRRARYAALDTVV